MLLQKHTQEQIDALVERPTHGVLLSGPEGAGKAHLARSVAARLLRTTPEKLENHAYFRTVRAEKGSLGIDQIRELQKFLHLKTPGQEDIRRVAILENAHLMTTEAQNALLKSLEEPPADTLIILTAPASQNIKETIYSRVRKIQVLPVDKRQAIDFFSESYEPAAVEKAYTLSGGHIGLMHALLADEDHPLALQIRRAKEIISSSRYERLARVDEIAKDKDALGSFLQACKLICDTALRNSAAKGSEQTKRWHRALAAVHDAEAALPHNPNTKLLLTDLMLNLI